MDGESRNSARLDRRETLEVVGLFLLAVGLRVLYVMGLRDNPYFEHPVLDPGYHAEWARTLARGEAFSDGPFFRAPLYVWFLSGVMAVTGEPCGGPKGQRRRGLAKVRVGEMDQGDRGDGVIGESVGVSKLGEQGVAPLDGDESSVLVLFMRLIVVADVAHDADPACRFKQIAQPVEVVFEHRPTTLRPAERVGGD